jgi:hypothetical protein
MSISDDPSSDTSPRRPRVRFSLLALLLFVSAFCLFLAWAVQPKKYVVESLFQVMAVPPSILAGTGSGFNEREYDILRDTQTALIKSNFVLQAALRGPGVATQPVFKSQLDPVAWLGAHLEVKFDHDSEILAIRMHCKEGEVKEYAAILDSVAQAYLNEVVFADDQRRLMTRDALAKSVHKLESELEDQYGVLEMKTKDVGKDSAEVKLRQIQIDALAQYWRQALSALDAADIEAEAPKRIMEIQPAVSRSE